jgi:hypothetical protein
VSALLNIISILDMNFSAHIKSEFCPIRTVIHSSNVENIRVAQNDGNRCHDELHVSRRLSKERNECGVEGWDGETIEVGVWMIPVM